MEFLIEVLDFLSRNRFGFLMFATLVFFLTKGVTLTSTISDAVKRPLSKVAILLIVMSILTLVFGTEITNQLIYKHGQIGEGLVVNTFETGDRYNEEPVVQYDVLIKTKTGETVETSFENTDFNMYPDSEGKNNYPSQGVRFTVKHLKNNPKTFIVVTNDDSHYAAKKSCDEQLRKLNTTKSQYDFAPNNTSYKEEYRKAITRYLDLGCNDNNTMIDFYQQEISKLD